MKFLIPILFIFAMGCAPKPGATLSATTKAANKKQNLSFMVGQPACSALRTWDSQKQSIALAFSDGTIFTFTSDGIYEINAQGISTKIVDKIVNAVYCELTIAGEKLTAVSGETPPAPAVCGFWGNNCD